MTQQQSRQGGTPPIGDEVRAELVEIGARYPQARSGLLPMLHLVQSVQGRVTAEGIEACAEVLGLSTAEVSGVATFYTMYKRRPVGDYHVGVCTNTLCAVMGGDEIFERLKDHLDVGNDETTEHVDGLKDITLEHVECNAACDYAPVVMVNWEFMDHQTPESAVQLVDDLRQGNEVRSTRGPRICTFRQAERVLAGFPDGLADEGPSAGIPSLNGLQLAQLNGWGPPPGRAGSEADRAEAAADQQRAAAQATAEDGQEGAAATEASSAGTKHEDAPGTGDEAQ
jgi:NADH-quinone oxidoreductase subunit E